MESKKRQPPVEKLKGDLFSEKDFKAIYSKYFDKVFSYIRSRVSNKEIADELIYDAFLKLWQQLSKGSHVSNVEAYLYKIIQNLLYDHYRAVTNQKGKQVFLDVLPEVMNTEHNPEQVLINEELRAELDKSISALPPQSALIFKMIKVDGLKYSEVADKLGISTNTVDTQLYRAVKKLRESLKVYKEQKVFFGKKVIENLAVVLAFVSFF